MMKCEICLSEISSKQPNVIVSIQPGTTIRNVFDFGIHISCMMPDDKKQIQRLVYYGTKIRKEREKNLGK